MRFLLLTFFLCAGAALANAEPSIKPADGEAVQIKGIRDPLLKPYRYMVAGLDAFDDYHVLAPNAPALRFKLQARQPGGDAMDGLVMRLRGDNTSMPLPLDADHTFALPRSEAALDDNADMELNKSKAGYRWHPDVRSEGVPAGMRRLGDLRLECKVLIGIGKKEIGLLWTGVVNSMLLTTDWCGHDKVKIGTPTTRKIAAATLVDGGQRIALGVAKDQLSYTPPLANKAIPDDALIEISYVDE